MDEWVMVPVPEEFVAQVQQYELSLEVGGLMPLWDAELISEHLATLDEDAHSLVRIVADDILEGEPPGASALAEQFGLSTREILGLTQEVNAVTLDPSPGNLVYVRHEQASEADGPKSVLYMWEPVAALVRAHVATGEDRRSTP